MAVASGIGFGFEVSEAGAVKRTALPLPVEPRSRSTADACRRSGYHMPYRFPAPRRI